jgi:Mg-chelatase subunit ChlI
MNKNFPFSAIIGQENLKLSLILATINPSLGGVLIRGEKGTAKSTAVRSLAALLPQQKVILNCFYGCDPLKRDRWCNDCKNKYKDLIKPPPYQTRKRPLVELPIGTSEDKLIGSLNLEQAVSKGQAIFEPGLLAKANRGILYVDEVNLLDDYLVDVLLDSASMGQNIIERESISIIHPSIYTLIGTMNPEEGELRPQLLDRFGLCVEIKGVIDVNLRKKIIIERLKYEENYNTYINLYLKKEEELGFQIEQASHRLENVKLNDFVINKAVDICLKLEVEGHRGDLTLIKTAITLAAWENKEIDDTIILTSAQLALPHRLRRKPFEDVDFNLKDKIYNII